MKTLRIKKYKEKVHHYINPDICYYNYIECRDYIVQMTEKRIF